MHIIKIISPIWSIRNKASLKNFFLSLVVIDGEEYVLMKLKDRYSPIKTQNGEYYIRKSNTKAWERLSDNYLWRLTKTKKDEFLDINNYFIEISQKIYNGWHLVVKGDKISTVDMKTYHGNILKLQRKKRRIKIQERRIKIQERKETALDE